MKIAISYAVLLGLLGVGCRQASEASGSGSNAATSTGGAILNGAGSTFVYPLMSRWTSDYQRVDPNVRLNYQSIGSGGGIRQVLAKTVDFGATDGPMTAEQSAEAQAPVLHIPLVLGAVVPTYNLPPLAHPIRFTPEALAGIFLGEVKVWNDPRLAADNADLALPATPIVVVRRSDGSGTTHVWTEYLSKVSPAWKAKVGNATSIEWPVGLGGRGNEGVAGTVRQTPGALGYVELTYALQNQMPVGQVRNRAGRFVSATIESVMAAAASTVAAIPEDLRYSMTEPEGAAAWPISGTTWALVRTDMPGGPARRAVASFLRWALADGQKACAPLHYAPLPVELAARGRAKLAAFEPMDPSP